MKALLFFVLIMTFYRESSAQGLMDLLNKASTLVNGVGSIVQEGRGNQDGRLRTAPGDAAVLDGESAMNDTSSAQKAKLRGASFSDILEFEAIYSRYVAGDNVDLAARRFELGLYSLLITAGADFRKCEGPRAGNVVVTLMSVKSKEVSDRGPDFLGVPSKSDVDEARRLVQQEWSLIAEGRSDPVCRKNGEIYLSIINQLTDTIDSVNRAQRAQRAAKYDLMLRESEVAEEKRRKDLEAAEERRIEEARVNEEKRRAAIAKEIEAERKAIEERERVEREKRAKRVAG